jgi:hypothetical protein
MWRRNVHDRKGIETNNLKTVIISIFRVFETASFGRPSGKPGTDDIGEALLDIWEMPRWQNAGDW